MTTAQITAAVPDTDTGLARADARRLVIVALGLARRAKADLETVIGTTDRDSRTCIALDDARRQILDVADKLEAAAHALQSTAQPSGPAQAHQLIRTLAVRVRQASRLVRTEMLAEDTTNIVWLPETDGAMSQNLIDAVNAAALTTGRLTSGDAANDA